MEEEDEATAKAVNDDDSEEAVLDPGTPIPSEEEDGGPCLGDAKKTTKVATVGACVVCLGIFFLRKSNSKTPKNGVHKLCLPRKKSQNQ